MRIENWLRMEWVLNKVVMPTFRLLCLCAAIYLIFALIAGIATDENLRWALLFGIAIGLLSTRI